MTRRAQRIRKIAREHVKGFDKPGGVGWRDMTDKLSPKQIAGLTGLLFLYNRFIADITIAIIRLKQAFDDRSRQPRTSTQTEAITMPPAER